MKLVPIEHYIGRLLPNWYPINALLIAPHFYRRFARLPRSPSSPSADYHDFLVEPNGTQSVERATFTLR